MSRCQPLNGYQVSPSPEKPSDALRQAPPSCPAVSCSAPSGSQIWRGCSDFGSASVLKLPDGRPSGFGMGAGLTTGTWTRCLPTDVTPLQLQETVPKHSQTDWECHEMHQQSPANLQSQARRILASVPSHPEAAKRLIRNLKA